MSNNNVARIDLLFDKIQSDKMANNTTRPAHWSYRHDFPIEEIWNTSQYLAIDIKSRLEAFKALNKHGFPSDFSEKGGLRAWNQTIQKMIDAFSLLTTSAIPNEEEKITISIGLQLFATYFTHLWD